MKIILNFQKKIRLRNPLFLKGFFNVIKRLIFAMFIAMLCYSCASMGPKTIPTDGFNYNQRILAQENEQILLNIVRLRYAETPLFINVSSIINQYSRDGKASIDGKSIFGSATAEAGVSGGWTDKPTITYTPMSGKAFSESLLQPISPAIVFYFIQSGWSPGRLLNITTSHINGTSNTVNTSRYHLSAESNFIVLTQNLEFLQRKGILGMEIKEVDREMNVNIFFPKRINDDSIKFAIARVKEILKLSPEINRFPIRYGPFQRDQEEIYLQTHSLLEIFFGLSNYIKVPEEHVSEGKTFGFDSPEFSDIIKIYSSKEKPENAYVAIKNRDYWFYIDDGDWNSKSTFGVVQVLLNLSRGTDPSKGPLISIGS